MEKFLEPLDKMTEEYYLKCFKEGDKRAKEVLVEHNLRLVAHIAAKYVDTKENRKLEELISVGTIGLIKAINNFDLNKGKLSTYAAKCIDNEILMMLRNERKRMREVSIYEPVGIDREGNEIRFFDVLEGNEKGIEEIFDENEDIFKIFSCMKNKLTKREYDIIRKRYGLYGYKEMTQREIAKEMNISRSYVSRIEKRALEKMRELIE